MDPKKITKETTVCFSGHRPEKLPDGGSEHSPLIKALKSVLYSEIKDAMNEGCNCFITGLSRGVDLWAGEMIINEKLNGSDVSLIAVSPCRDFGKKFKGYDKWIFSNIILRADRIFYIGEEHTRSCYKERNLFMTQHSGRLIAVMKEQRSGTGNTVRLAEKQGLKVRVIDVNKIEAESETAQKDAIYEKFGIII